MKISAVRTNFYSFKGRKELNLFRQEAVCVIKAIDNMQCECDYTKFNESVNDSIQKKLKLLLFKIVPSVGSENATKEDKDILNILKKRYIFLEDGLDLYKNDYKITKSNGKKPEVIDIKF